jgi:hypothetical protein
VRDISQRAAGLVSALGDRAKRLRPAAQSVGQLVGGGGASVVKIVVEGPFTEAFLRKVGRVAGVFGGGRLGARLALASGGGTGACHDGRGRPYTGSERATIGRSVGRSDCAGD